jgi:hypothetical protein
MARTRTRPTILTNVHPIGRTCLICRGPIINGQGAYVTTDNRPEAATHSSANQCTSTH